MRKTLLTILPLLLLVGCELKNGIYSDFYSNGQKSFEKNFSNGVENGNWVYFYSNGQKFLKITYKDGKLIESKKWDRDGNLIED